MLWVLIIAGVSGSILGEYAEAEIVMSQDSGNMLRAAAEVNECESIKDCNTCNNEDFCTSFCAKQKDGGGKKCACTCPKLDCASTTSCPYSGNLPEQFARKLTCNRNGGCYIEFANTTECEKRKVPCYTYKNYGKLSYRAYFYESCKADTDCMLKCTHEPGCQTQCKTFDQGQFCACVCPGKGVRYGPPCSSYRKCKVCPNKLCDRTCTEVVDGKTRCTCHCPYYCSQPSECAFGTNPPATCAVQDDGDGGCILNFNDFDNKAKNKKDCENAKVPCYVYKFNATTSKNRADAYRSHYFLTCNDDSDCNARIKRHCAASETGKDCYPTCKSFANFKNKKVCTCSCIGVHS